jgi:hypothetical protein
MAALVLNEMAKQRTERDRNVEYQLFKDPIAKLGLRLASLETLDRLWLPQRFARDRGPGGVIPREA